MRSLRWALIQCDWCLYKKGKVGEDTDTGRRPHEDEGKDKRDAFTSQGAPKIARSWGRHMD